MTQTLKALRDLVEAFYGQTPRLPKTSVTFKIKRINAVEILKEHNIELPKYNEFQAKRQLERE